MSSAVADLKKLKIQIKFWENEFLKTNSKKPDKSDIQNAPEDIKNAYKNYWKFKPTIDVRCVKGKQDDDIWSKSLNKSKLSKSLSYVPKANSYCEKMKQKSYLKSAKKPSLEIPKDVIKLPESPINIESCNVTKDLTAEEKTQDCFDIIEFKPLETFSKVVKNDTLFKKTYSASLLSPYSNNLKTLSLKDKLSKDWLDRCNEVLEKEKAEISNTKNTTTENKVNSANDSKIDTAHQVSNLPPKVIAHNKMEFDSVIMKNPQIEIQALPIKETSVNEENVIDNVKCVNKEICLLTDSEIKKPLTDNNNDLEVKDKKCSQNSDSSDNFEQEISQKVKKRKLSDVSTNIAVKSDSYKTNHLKKKIASGTVNENFIRLNIKKKKFSRGHRPTNVKKLKWTKWKQLKNGSSNASDTPTNIKGCFKCGEFGHWARNCNVMTKKEDEKTGFEEMDVDDAPLPTLEEAARLAHEKRNSSLSRATSRNISQKENDENVDDQNIPNTTQFSEVGQSGRFVQPLYDVTEDGSPIETPKAVLSALKEMGFKSFRKGQEDAIMRVLCGLSTLVVLPTGSGKSLCYQLPAFMYAKKMKSIALVVSPLVSLMEDQVVGLSSCLHAVCLHSGMTETQKSNAMKDVTNGVAQILLVSPEAIIGSYSLADALLDSSLPPISFACIDEVHCISQWSHNFRPSYLQLYKVLTQKFKVKCILGLTATATQTTVKDICSNLELNIGDNSVIGSTNVPDNLLLSISKDKDRDKALIQLLTGDRFSGCNSIIIYCIRRAETERLAALIRTCLQDQVAKPTGEPKEKKKKGNSKKRDFLWTAEAYHAGLAHPRRRSIQKRFMSGKLRVVIATVAFGMGLDKPDVRAIIHYNMPKTFENYVQEIGRAGRDGLESHCHLFLDNEGHDLCEQQRHIYANSIDRFTLRKLLKRVFVTCKCNSNLKEEPHTNDSNLMMPCPKHEVAFPINETVQELDVKQENISTLLCYLELHSNRWIEILSPTYATCTIRCYGGPSQMHSIALKNPIVSAAIALDELNGKKWEKSVTYMFPVVGVASAIGIKSSSLKQELKRLEWNENRKKSGAIVEFSDLSFHISSPGNLSDEQLDDVLDFLYKKVKDTEESELKNLRMLFSVFQRYSFSHYWECCDEIDLRKSSSIKEEINQYFSRNNVLSDNFEDSDEIQQIDFDYVRRFIKELICTHHDQNFTGRAIARIFHGIDSPCFPSEIWGKVRKFWRCLLSVNFNLILKLANDEIRNCK